MRVIIAGSRDCLDISILIEAITKSGFDITEVVCGMARGADMLGHSYAATNGIPIAEYPAQWYQDKQVNGRKERVFVKAAGYQRNTLMAENADALIALWDGVSKGTKHMIDIATERKLRVYVHKYINTDAKTNPFSKE